MIYIRTDANSEIASGHLMRCLTIAREVRRLGGEVCFLLSDKKSEHELLIRLKEEENWDIKILMSDYRNPEAELEKLFKLISPTPKDCILVDSYFVTTHYLEHLNEQIRVIYLDDLQKFDYSVDTIINYDLVVEHDFYRNALKVYAGGKYAPLRSMFEDVDYEVKEQLKNVLLATGGTDPVGFAPSFVEYFYSREELRTVTLHVLVGSMSQHKEALYRLAEHNTRVCLHENISEVSTLMKECDAAVCAGGNTLYELCAVGVPTIGFALSKSQIPCLSIFEQMEVIPYLGEADKKGIFEEIYAKLMEFSGSVSVREKASKKEKATVDGKGATRIAQILLTQATEQAV